MWMVWDSESSGLRRDDLPPDDPSQPHIVQLAAAVFDGQWKRRDSFEVLIQPRGWSIEPEAASIHGLTGDTCERYGVPIEYALGMLQAFTDKALTFVAHNAAFDRQMVASELARMPGINGLWWAKLARRHVCSMELGTSICKLPGQFGQWKFPSLTELHRHLFPDESFESKHGAEADLMATARCYREMQVRGLVQ